jgi:hypothetical protein
MRHTLAAAIAVSLLVAGCSSTTVGSDDFAREDAVDCRELGGGWVFIRYEQQDSSMQGLRLGVPTSDEELAAEPNVSDEEFDEATRQRVAEGWEDETVSQLQGPDAPTELMTRLADMPSCLDQLTVAQR